MSPETEPIDIGDTTSLPKIPGGGEPVLTLITATDQVTVEWPHGRPDSVMIQTDLFEDWVMDRNRMAAEIFDLSEKVKAMRTMLTVIRLGRRPNRRDWESINMLHVPRRTQLDILRRARRQS